MLRLSKEVFYRYQSRLKELGVGDQVLPHWVKWVRYFLDYEAKYGKGAPEISLIDGFIAKLASKGQSFGLRKQARQAVEVFLEMGPGEDPAKVEEEPEEYEVKARSSLPVETELRSGWRELERALTAEIKRRNYSPKTMQAYQAWVQRFGQYTEFKPVDEICDEDAKNFLTDLAVKGEVVASTQNQAFNALLFLFRHILKREYDLKDRVVRAKRTKYIPTVLTKTELEAVIGELKFPYDLIVSMLYGCGLRLSECLELRINNLDFVGECGLAYDPGIIRPCGYQDNDDLHSYGEKPNQERDDQPTGFVSRRLRMKNVEGIRPYSLS
ncbi:MAG: phage integrase N-terminal SAM-like domain-containing protein [Opitutales bacterium]|nr:phage integrase N-terminal SAM-like domain-containing protein [Opitutales bacterium]